MVEANPPGSPASCESESSGFALVAVLVFLLIVSAITSTFALTAWTRLKIASNETESQRLGLLAEGLTNVLAARLSSGGPDIGLPLNFEPVSCVVGNLTVVTRLQGHAGLIDLNAADHNLLALGFASLGLDKETSGGLSIAVEYFRSGASIFAATAKAKVEIAGGYKFAQFESVAELQDFTPLRAVPLPDLYRIFTIHSRSGVLVPAEASVALAAMVKANMPAPSQASRSTPEPAFTIQVTITRRGSPIVGSAAYIFESRSGGALHRAAMSPASDEPAATSAAGSCEPIFGTAVTRMLADLR